MKTQWIKEYYIEDVRCGSKQEMGFIRKDIFSKRRNLPDHHRKLNMTSAALTVNKEWNTKLISTESGEIAKEIVDEFQNLWNSEYALPYDDFYEVYKERYNIVKHQREIAKSEEILSLEKYSIS